MLNVVTTEKAEEILSEKFSFFSPEEEKVALSSCVGRFLSQDVVSQENIPSFNRSTVDGYAVKSENTFGSGESIPSMLEIKGEILMGEEAGLSIEDGECLKISTGGMLPEGADAAVMVEFTETLADETCLIFKAVSPFENVTRKGDDVRKNQVVLKRGTLLSSRHVGVLAALGKTEVMCFKKLRVGIISSGDEIVPIEEKTEKGKVRDINSHILSAMLSQKGCVTDNFGIVKDKYDEIEKAVLKAAETCDIVLISGGSSAGARDMTVRVIENNGEVFFHGIAVKPGKPTIGGKIADKLILGLPGHPAAAFFICEILLSPLLSLFYKNKNEKVAVKAKISSNISSNHGREEIIPVILENNEATPLFFKSSIISLLSNAHGYVRIDRNKEGLKKGEEVEVFLF